MRITRSLLGIGLVTLCGTAPLTAHHAFTAEFDPEKPVKLEGTVTKMEFTNPHSWIYIDVKRPDGTVEHWAIEGSAPNGLLRRGWTKRTLQPGTPILVGGFRSRDGALRATGRSITLPDGRQFFSEDPK